MLVLDSKSEAEIREAGETCIRLAGHGGRYILGGGTSGIFTPRIAEGFLTLARVSAELSDEVLRGTASSQ